MAVEIVVVAFSTWPRERAMPLCVSARQYAVAMRCAGVNHNTCPPTPGRHAALSSRASKAALSRASRMLESTLSIFFFCS